MNLSTSVFLPDLVGPHILTQRRLHVVVKASISPANYTILAQSRDEMMVPDNSPSISMWPYLCSSSQTRRLNKISVYAERGRSRERSRLLYMNASALSLWREMGMPVTIIGESHRPSIQRHPFVRHAVFQVIRKFKRVTSRRWRLSDEP